MNGKKRSMESQRNQNQAKIGSMYSYTKNEPVPEVCVTSKNTAGARRVIAGLSQGCVPIAVEVGRHTGTPYIERVYK